MIPTSAPKLGKVCFALQLGGDIPGAGTAAAT